MNDDQFPKLMAVLERIAVALESEPPPSTTPVHTHRPRGLLLAGDIVNTEEGEGKILQVSESPHGSMYAVALTASNEVFWYKAVEVEKV